MIGFNGFSRRGGRDIEDDISKKVRLRHLT